ncbi:Nn.00g048390.m01.CDS01 [Neocucurbitaria sp. VM-36]
MTADTLEFNSSVDTWNHPKIPRIEVLEQDEARKSSDRPWFNVEKQVNQTYASLTGIDVLNFVESADANFTVPYEYMCFECGLHPSTNATTNLGVMEYLNDLQKANRLQSGGAFTYNTTWTTVIERGFFIYGISNGSSAEKLLYGSQLFPGSMYLFECSMRSVLVEENIECTSDACDTKRIRRLGTPRRERNASYLPYDAVHDEYTFKYFITHIAGIGGETSNMRPNPIHVYVYGVTPWTVDANNMAPRHNWAEYIGVPQKSIEMSQRLTKLLNTYWDASRWPLATTRNDPYAKSSLDATSGEPVKTPRMNKTEAVIARLVLICKADVPWVASLVICSSMLLILGRLMSLRLIFLTTFRRLHVTTPLSMHRRVARPPVAETTSVIR